jgi:hypothetical protein
VNWFYSGKENSHGEVIYSRNVQPESYDMWRPTASLTLGSTLADKVRFIVPPVAFKNSLMQHESIRSLWAMAGARLNQASHLIAIGYSLPASDIVMGQFLGSTLPAQAIVTVVNPDPEVGKKFESLLGRPVRAFCGEGFFARFLDTLADDRSE